MNVDGAFEIKYGQQEVVFYLTSNNRRRCQSDWSFVRRRSGAGDWRLPMVLALFDFQGSSQLPSYCHRHHITSPQHYHSAPISPQIIQIYSIHPSGPVQSRPPHSVNFLTSLSHNPLGFPNCSDYPLPRHPPCSFLRSRLCSLDSFRSTLLPYPNLYPPSRSGQTPIVCGA